MKKFINITLAILLSFTFSSAVAADGNVINVDDLLNGEPIVLASNYREKKEKRARRKAREDAKRGIRRPKKPNLNTKFNKGRVYNKKYGPTKKTVNLKTKYKPGSIIIRTSERKIYLVGKNGKAIQYGIAVGSTAGRQWKGKTYISRKRPNPTWIPTASILRESPKMKRVYKPGPRNPLGVRAMNLANTPTLRIHGTNQPWTIGKAVSHGCFRMRNSDVVDLYSRVKVGTRVYIKS